ncbi:MAG: OmpA family protein [Deltaproteobacteria bacterium]|nr:OmpA family protein [Deltaproteobacteria bacterium]
MHLLGPRQPSPEPEPLDPPDFWLSISDVMTGLVMLFLLILLGVLVHKGRQLEEQRQAAAEKEAELRKVETRVRLALGVRAELVEQLQRQFRAVQSPVEVDPRTGALRIGEAVLFGFNSAVLTPQGRSTVLAVYQTLSTVLFMGSFPFREHLSEIAIEGHASREPLALDTDPFRRASYLANLDLSQRRAHAVLAFLAEQPEIDQATLARYGVAIGYGFSRLRDDAHPESGANRRIEITFRLHDDRSLESLRDLLERVR